MRPPGPARRDRTFSASWPSHIGLDIILLNGVTPHRSLRRRLRFTESFGFHAINFERISIDYHAVELARGLD